MTKLLTLLGLLLIMCSGMNAQIQPQHEKKIYKAPDGKLYIQKSLPVYVRMATSPNDNAETYLLQSETTKKYANPMYFDAEGFNSFRSPSQVDTVTRKPVLPKQDIIFEIYADSETPVTTIQFNNTEVLKQKGKTYLKGKATLSLASSDKISGVENIYFSVDSAKYQVYTSAFTLDSEKQYTIRYYAVDNVGNVETIKEVVVVADHTLPKTTHNLLGNYFDNILAAKASINITANDGSGVGIAKIIYKLDGGPEKLYIAPINASVLEQGEHKFVYYSTDRVNNRESENVFEFYVDKTAPTVIQEISGKSFVANGREYSSGRSQLKISTIDNKAGIKEIFYSINNEAYKKYEKPVTLANTSGTLSVKSYAVDNVNNVGYYNDKEDNSKVGKLSYVDLSGPAVSHQFVGPVFVYNDSVFINSKTKIILKASDAESGLNHIEYIVNNSETSTYTSGFMISDEGMQAIEYTGFDNVDNTALGKVSVMVDNSGPEIFYRFSAPALAQGVETYPDYVSLFVSATDKLTGFSRMTYALNDQPDKLFTGYIANFLTGTQKLLIKVYDKLGNQTSETIEFRIK